MVSGRGPDPVRTAPGLALAAAAGIGLLGVGLGLWRLMPGVGFWDTAEFQMVPPVLGTAHPTGYPSYVLIGWIASILLTPLGEAALRMNVLSAILVGVAITFTVDLARRLTGSLALGVAAGVGTALTPIVWGIGTHADPHALHAAFIAIILWLLVRWEQARRGNSIDGTVRDVPDGGGTRTAEGRERGDRFLLAAAVVVGLSVGNHSLTLLLGPPILLFVFAVDPSILSRRRFIAANVAAFLIPTVLVRFEMVLRAGWLRAPFVYADPSTWAGFWYVTLGAQFHSWLTDPFGNPGKRLADLASIASGQFGILGGVILVAVIVTAFRQPRYAILTGTAMVLTCFFNSVYPDGAIDRYYIGPALIAWTWLAISGRAAADVVVGMARRWRRLSGRRGEGTGARWVPAVAAAAIAVALLVPSLTALSVRASVVDRTQDRAAERWTDEVLTAVDPNAVIVSWWSYSTPLWYAQVVDDRRPDVCIIDDRTRLDYALGELDQVIARYLPTRPVYLIRNGDSELPALVGRYNVTPSGLPDANNLLRVSPIRTSAASLNDDASSPELDTPATRATCP